MITFILLVAGRNLRTTLSLGRWRLAITSTIRGIRIAVVGLSIIAALGCGGDISKELVEHDALVGRRHGTVLEGEHILSLRNVCGFLLEGVGLEAPGVGMSSVYLDEGLHRLITRQLLKVLLDVVDELVDRCQLIRPLAEEASDPLFKLAALVGALRIGVSTLDETVNHAEESIVSLPANVLGSVAYHLLDVSSDTLVVR